MTAICDENIREKKSQVLLLLLWFVVHIHDGIKANFQSEINNGIIFSPQLRSHSLNYIVFGTIDFRLTTPRFW